MATQNTQKGRARARGAHGLKLRRRSLVSEQNKKPFSPLLSPFSSRFFSCLTKRGSLYPLSKNPFCVYSKAARGSFFFFALKASGPPPPGSGGARGARGACRQLLPFLTSSSWRRRQPPTRRASLRSLAHLQPTLSKLSKRRTQRAGPRPWRSCRRRARTRATRRP